jgi:alkylation response protein AidB-like acyl-CoA dehydrogenase
VSHYKSNVRDIEFNLLEVLGRGDVLGQGPYADMDVDTAREVLSEIDRLAKNEVAESFAGSDRTPPVFDPETHDVTMPEAFKKSYHAYMDAEWFRLELPTELGGQPTRRRCAGPRPS